MSTGESFVYLEIAEAIRRLIVSGQLKPGDRLPSVRVMAEHWRCTPNTVSRGYALLSREGLVVGHRGGGTRVVSTKAGPNGAAPPEWEWASLVNRAETYLLESLSQGHSPAHAEAALAAAISRWQDLRRPASPEKDTTFVDRDAREIRFSGSHDLSVELLGRSLLERTPPVTLTIDFIGSLGGLMALARGEADVAGAHLWDEATGVYNAPFVQRVLPNRKVVLLDLVQRLQGLIVPAGNPQGLRSIADLARPEVRFINRQAGSGTRVWLDIRLRDEGIPPAGISGYDQEETTHLGVARAVAEGRANAGMGISAAATAYGLGFVPLGEERYDLVIPAEVWGTAALLSVREVVNSQHFKDAILALGGYDVSQTGSETILD
jgi:molybdate-binding protein/DNA-binding transcriptional regulator YhcF (GntR family)